MICGRDSFYSNMTLNSTSGKWWISFQIKIALDFVHSFLDLEVHEKYFLIKPQIPRSLWLIQNGFISVGDCRLYYKIIRLEDARMYLQLSLCC